MTKQRVILNLESVHYQLILEAIKSTINMNHELALVAMSRLEVHNQIKFENIVRVYEQLQVLLAMQVPKDLR
jgi:hypothetical protein